MTSAGWQVTLCDPMWHVSSRSGVATLRTAIHLLLRFVGFTFLSTAVFFSVTHSLFHSRLKTFLFCKSFAYRSLSFSSSGLTTSTSQTFTVKLLLSVPVFTF